MIHRTFPGRLSALGSVILGIAAAFLTLPDARSQVKPPPRVSPKLEPIAETKLLMEGLAHANFRGLERNLSTKPTEDQTWTFARGQSLLIAETANLLMLRPPKREGQDIWFQRAMDLRSKATSLAQVVSTRNLEQSRKGLIELAASCTKCHQNFRVPVIIEPFTEVVPKVE